MWVLESIDIVEKCFDTSWYSTFKSVKYSQIIQSWIPQQSSFETTNRPSRQSFRFWLTFYVWNFWCFMCRFMSIWQICHVKRLDIMLAWMPSVPWSVHLCILLKDLAHSAPAIVFPSLASLWDKLSMFLTLYNVSLLCIAKFHLGLVCCFFFSCRFWSASISQTILGTEQAEANSSCLPRRKEKKKKKKNNNNNSSPLKRGKEKQRSAPSHCTGYKGLQESQQNAVKIM